MASDQTITYREELAGRLEAGARLCRKDERNTIALLLDEAAAALRQSPSVEEVARVICAHEVGGFCQNIGGDLGCTVGRGASPCGSRCIATDAQLHLSGRMQTAQAIAALYGRGG